MTEYQLGDKVDIFDRMLRVRVGRWDGERAMERLQELWPSAFVKEALERNIYNCKLWVPAMVVKQLQQEYIFLSVQDRYQTGMLDVEPKQGIVTRKVVLHSGSVIYDSDYGATYERFSSSVTGYEVTYALNRRPVTVMEDQIAPPALKLVLVDRNGA